MSNVRRVVLSVPVEVADRIEDLTKKKLKELGEEFFLNYFNDGRRTQVATKEISVRFPLDWFRLMLQRWGDGKISSTIRSLIYAHICKPADAADKWRLAGKNPADWLTEPPKWKDRTARGKNRTPKSVAGGPSCIKQIQLPQDWHDRLVEMYDGQMLSTVVKSLVYKELLKLQPPKELSIPKQFRLFM